MTAHAIEYWERKGEKRSQWTAACLSCGWFSSDGTRGEAHREAEMHERGEYPPWVVPPGENRQWHPGKHPTPDR